MKTWKDIGIDLPDEFTGERHSTCPQCSPKRKKSKVKCLSANGDSLKYKCHHCDFQGSLKDGIYDRGDVSKWDKPKQYSKPEYSAYTEKLDSKVIKYFETRGISERTLGLNKIGYGKIYMPQVEDFVTAVQFPFYRNGEVVNIKYRDANKNFRLASGAERILYNIDGVPAKSKELVICEGEIDCLSIQEAGISNVVSIPDGAPSPKAKSYENKFTFLESGSEFLDKFEAFILAVDNDEPGKVLEKELSRRLGIERCKRVDFPEGCKDANDVLLKHGKEKLKQVICEAKDFPIEGLFELNDFKQDFLRLYRYGFEIGLSTGWTDVDACYTVRPGELTLVSGIPGSGKSAWLNALAVNMIKHEWITGFYSPEYKPLERHAAALMEILTGQSFDTRGDERISEEMISDYWGEMINHYFKFILPSDTTPHTLDNILNLARIAVLKYGLKGLIIDPWNQLEHMRPQGMTETEYISLGLTKIVNFAQARKIHIWLVVHPSKMEKDKEGKIRVPTAYDLSGSSHWFNKAFNIITVHREKRGAVDDDHKVQIHIQKIKFKEVGRLGMVELKYDRDNGRYSHVFY